MAFYMDSRNIRAIVEEVVDVKLKEALLRQAQEEFKRKNEEEIQVREEEISRTETELKERFPLFSKVSYLGLEMIVRGTFVRRYPFISDVTLCVSTEWLDKHNIFQHRDFHDEELKHLKLITAYPTETQI